MASRMADAYIGLGANLGDAAASIALAVQAIAGVSDLVLVRQSSVYRSAPVDAIGPDFFNAVAQVRTKLAPLALLSVLQAIEVQAGRTRPYPNAPRTLDLDLLLYDQQTMASSVLTLPHPRMWQRAFVLLPLAEIAPHLVSAAQLLAVQDQAIVRA